MTIVSPIDTHPADAIALIEGDETTTYGRLRELCAEARAGLVAAGLQRGDRVGIVCTNTRASAVAILASLSAGMVALPLDSSSPAPELERDLDAVGAALVLTCIDLPGDIHHRVATLPGTTVAGIEPLPAGPDQPPVHVNEDDLAVMLFTSGTAGAPKAAMISHGNLAFNQHAILDHPANEMTPGSVMLAVLPFSHIYGLNITLLAPLRGGATVVLQDRFDAAETVDLIGRHRVTLVAGVPPMWRALLDLDDVGPDAFATIVRITSGASALTRAVWTEFHERFGIELSEGYGLTETSPLVTSHLGVDVRPGSVGKPIPGIEVEVVDHDGNPAPIDDSGEIRVRGPNVFMGYWDDEEATKTVLDHDGWLFTGDVGVFSADGYLHLVDRAKDLIIVSGFNVYPFEVEAVLTQHPAIDQAVVIGRDDDQRGERVVAYVIATEGQPPPALDEVIAFARQELARYKCPSELHVVDELPIASTGKRIRRELA